MTDDRLTSDELFAIFKGLIPTPVAFYLMNGGAKLDRGALEMVQAVREQATNDHIEAQAAEIEALKTMIFATGEAAATNLRTAMERALEIERLREAGQKLNDYACHDDDCQIVTHGVWSDPIPCTCGYEDAWKAWAELGDTK
jgi:hypothetical protein